MFAVIPWNHFLMCLHVRKVMNKLWPFCSTGPTFPPKSWKELKKWECKCAGFHCSCCSRVFWVFTLYSFSLFWRHLMPSSSGWVNMGQVNDEAYRWKWKFLPYQYDLTPYSVQTQIIIICEAKLPIYTAMQCRTQEFCSGGVQQIQLRTERTDLGAVAP